MPSKSIIPPFSLPRAWREHVKSAVLQVISLARYALTYSRSWAADCRNDRVRRMAENSRLMEEVALLHEEMRIKDCRMKQIPPHRRPFPQRRSTARLARRTRARIAARQKMDRHGQVS
jgi:hypothetical protein